MEKLESQIQLTHNVLDGIFSAWSKEFGEIYEPSADWDLAKKQYPLSYEVDPDSQFAAALDSVFVRPGFTVLSIPETFESTGEQINWQYVKMLSYTGYEVRFSGDEILLNPVGIIP